MDVLVRPLADQDLARLRVRLQAGGQVDAVADDRVLHAVLGAHRPGHHLARAHPDAHRHGVLPLGDPPARQLGDPRLHGEGGPDRPDRVILVEDRGAEDRHDPVAEELVEDALFLERRVDHQGVELVQERDDLLGTEPLGEGGEAPHVAEEHGHVTTLLLEHDLLGVLEDLVHHLSGHVAGEGVLDHLLLPEAPRHLVEGLGQEADLVVGGNGQRDLEVPGGDGPGALGQPEDGARDHGGQGQRAADPEEDHDRADEHRLVAGRRHRLLDRALTEPEIEGADEHVAEPERHGEVEDPALLGVDVGLNGEVVRGELQAGRPLEAVADLHQVGMGDDLAVGVDEHDVDDVGIPHPVLNEEREGEVVVREEGVPGRVGEAAGDGEAALRHLRGQAILLLPDQERADRDDGHDQESGDEESELQLEGQPDAPLHPTPARGRLCHSECPFRAGASAPAHPRRQAFGARLRFDADRRDGGQEGQEHRNAASEPEGERPGHRRSRASVFHASDRRSY